MAKSIIEPGSMGLKRAGKIFLNLLAFLPLSSQQLRTSRQEANAICAQILRNTSLEDLHGAGKITDIEMKQLMIEASASLEAWLLMRDVLMRECPELYRRLADVNLSLYSSKWEINGDTYNAKTGKASSCKANEGPTLSEKMIQRVLKEPCTADGSSFEELINQNAQST